MANFSNDSNWQGWIITGHKIFPSSETFGINPACITIYVNRYPNKGTFKVSNKYYLAF